MKTSIISLIILGVLFLLPILAFSTTINVPVDQPTIQAGINAAVNGDTVLVARGTYQEANIEFKGKVISVVSYFIIDSLRETIDSTIIDADFSGCIFSISGGHMGQAVEGFTLQNGTGCIKELPPIPYGGAFSISSSGPIIRNNIIRNCDVDGYGGAIYLEGADALISNNIFKDNSAQKGGAIFLKGTDISEIAFNSFVRNNADTGGALFYWINSTSIVCNCTFYENIADEGGGIYFDLSSPTIQKAVISSSKNGGAIQCSNSNPTFICSDLIGNIGFDWVGCIADQYGVNGNYSLDPMFCDTANNDFSIYNISPCAPENNSCEVLIGAFEVGCYAPVIDSIAIDTIGDNQHVFSLQPKIQWNYYDPINIQSQFEIAVGTDDDWTYAEMWNPALYETSDTFVVYNGATLIDGETYYLRLRVNNGVIWSEWYETTFRMNSLPSIPVQLNPIGGIIVETNQPTFWIENSTDAETDSLTYDYMIYDKDSMMPGPIYAYNIIEQPDSTGWQIDTPLPENWLLFWKARSFDQYEYSEWSESDSFWVNTEPNSPYEFQANYPPDTGGSFVYDMLPTFLWAPSFDPDPFDSVYYTLLISIDSDFTFVNTTDSIWQNEYTKTDSLDFTTRYWWKVKATDNAGLFIYSSNAPDFRTWMLGDVNADWNVDLLDILFLINYKYKDGPAPDPMFIGDVNADCVADLLDILYLIQYKYKGGDEPKIGCE